MKVVYEPEILVEIKDRIKWARIHSKPIKEIVVTPTEYAEIRHALDPQDISGSQSRRIEGVPVIVDFMHAIRVSLGAQEPKS